VTSFCHAHALPLSTGHLCELAQANDWVGLLHEAQTQHFPLWQVRDIVRRHVASPAVRAHILCALRDRAGSAKRDDDDVEGEDEDENDEEDDEIELAAALSTPSELLEADHVVFDALLQALDPSNERPGESLLGRALQAGSVTLAVLATCFADVRTLDCVVVFLFASQSKVLAAHLDRIEIPSSLAQLEQCVAALLNADDGGVGADAVHDALSLLCPQCPLRHYVDFHRAVRTSRLDVAQPALAAFVAAVTRSPALVSDDDARAGGSGVALSQPCAWQQRVACDAALALLAALSNEEERALALQLLAGAELAPRFATLRVAVDIVRECRVPVPWSELCGGEELAVRRVARARALGAARRLARCFELHALADRIACREADHLASSLTAKRRALACIAVNNVARLDGAPSPENATTPARVAAVQQLMPFMSMSKIESGFTPARVKSPPPASGSVSTTAQAQDPAAVVDAVVVDSGTAWHWQRCSQLLVDSECAATVGGDWFLEKVGTDTRRVEQLWLMREALAWYKGECGGVDGKRAGPAKPRQLVSQLEMRIMFAADELADSTTSSSTEPSSSITAVASSSSDRVPRSLVNVVGRLLQRGDVSQARALCRQYQYESVDVQLVEVARRYALGTPAAIVAGSFPPVAQQLVDAHNKRAVLLGGVAPDTSLSGASQTPAATLGVDESMVVVDASLDSQRSIVIGILMAGCTSHGARMACVQARARCDVARALNAPSEAIAARDPLDVLNVLVRAGRARLALAEAWVACHALDAERVAHILARAYISAHRRYNPRVRATVATESPLAVPAPQQPAAADSSAGKKSGTLASVRRALFGGRRKATADDDAPVAASTSARTSTDALDEPARAAVSASFDGTHESTSPVSPSEADVATSLTSPLRMRHRAGAAPADEEIPGTGIERQWTTEEFTTFARLCSEPALLGRALETELSRFSESHAEVDDGAGDALDVAAQVAQAARSGGADRQLSYACECELLVAAYRCFDVAGDAEAAASLLARMRERAPLFARAGEHRLLVRLYTGARAYAQMRWLLDLLVRYDRFELILGKRVAVEADKERLCASLESYLRQQLLRMRGPTEVAAIERLQQMLYLRFSMWRSIGRALETRANAAINDICESTAASTTTASSAAASSSAAEDAGGGESRRRVRRSNDNVTASAASEVALLGVFGPANEQRLLGAMRTLLDAADHYVRANFPGAARRCVIRAVLIGAQLREPATRLIGLSMNDARRLMTHHGAFDATLAVARGYSLDDTASWVRATYQQVVVRGNMPFMSRMIIRGMRPRVLAGDVVALYRSDQVGNDSTLSATRRGNLQAFLRAALDDAVALYDFCVQLGFTEMATYVRQSRALQFLRPGPAASSAPQ
jgi:hypothetical protein